MTKPKPKSFDEQFREYLSERCAEPGCESVATHNQPYRKGHGWCNTHTDWDQPAFARSD